VELRRSRSSTSALRVCLHRFDSPLLRLATAPLPFLHSHLRYKQPVLLYFFLRLRRLVRCLPSERDMVGCIQITVYIRPYLFRIVHIFWTAHVCVNEVSLHVPLRSELEFRQHLPIVLRIHKLLCNCRTCIGRTTGRCCRNSVSDRSGAWKLTSSTHTRVGLGPILTY